MSGTTDVLIVGRGEKGEGGKPNGKGEAPQTSESYRTAARLNGEAKQGDARRIAVISEEHVRSRLISPDLA